MSIGRRIGKIISGLLIIAGAFILMKVPEVGHIIIALILAVSLLVLGISSLIYYFTMARHMVGGRDTLYTGLIEVDLALFTLSVTDIPKVFVMVYLVVVFGVTGVLHILRGLEAKKKQASGWCWRVIDGAIYLSVAVLCQIFLQNTVAMVTIFAFGLIYLGAERIVSSFYRSKIVYVQ